MAAMLSQLNNLEKRGEPEESKLKKLGEKNSLGRTATFQSGKKRATTDRGINVGGDTRHRNHLSDIVYNWDGRVGRHLRVWPPAAGSPAEPPPLPPDPPPGAGAL